MTDKPDWCDIINWNDINPENMKFIHEEATLCYADALDGYKALKSRCEQLFILCVTLMAGLSGYIMLLTVDIESYSCISDKFKLLIASCVALILLAKAIFTIYDTMFGTEVCLQGQPPKEILLKKYLHKQPLQNLIFADVETIQTKIDDIAKIKKPIAKKLKSSLLTLAAIPVLVLIIFLSVSFSQRFLGCPLLVKELRVEAAVDFSDYLSYKKEYHILPLCCQEESFR